MSGRRPAALALALTVIAGLFVAAPVSPAGAATVRSVGAVPLEDVRAAAAAAARPDCGLSADRLAAMLLAPVFHETGAVWTPNTSPSPMTLGRWDDQSALFAFGNRTTRYQRAFWNAGVGMWQFDSAGGWNMTAADAISTQTSAQQAALTMASRFCASTAADTVGRMRFAWSLWYACVSGGQNVCVDRFNEMYVGGRFVNVRPDPTVGRLGGMEPATCRIGPSTLLACHRVDPARAEGHRTWAAPTAGPTPLSAPFYVFARDGREYRYWLAADTGYGQTVIAHKPIRANARTSLTWAISGAQDALCDETTGRGDCRTPRVATTPWGDRVGEPFGSVDVVRAGMGSVTVAGWAIDPDANAPVTVEVWIDGVLRRASPADRRRADVAAVVPGYGELHGFRQTIEGVVPGRRTVCLRALNLGPFGTFNPDLGCQTVAVSAPPVGALDAVSGASGAVRLQGWAADRDLAGSVTVRALVDGAVVGSDVANQARLDVARVFPDLGASRGFSFSVSVPGGTTPRKVCAEVIDSPLGVGWELGCRMVTLPANLTGSLDSARPATGGVRVGGWLLNQTSAGPVSLTVTADGVAVATATADLPRPDVAAAYPGVDVRRGFRLDVPVTAGRRTICVRVGSWELGCRTVDVAAAQLIGSLDVVRSTGGGVRVAGWLVDRAVSESVPLTVRVDGAVVATAVADLPRPDVAAAYPGVGDRRGFRVEVPATSGTHTICIWSGAWELGCRSVVIS